MADPTTSQWLTAALETGLLVVTGAVTFFGRRFVNSASSGRNVDVISRLAGSAIDYVEHVDLRRRLDPSLEPAAEASGDKMTQATMWLAKELKRSRISMKPEEAEQWVKSELQRRVDAQPPTKLIAKYAAEAIAEVLVVEKSGRLSVPEGQDELGYSVRLASDRVITRLAETGTRLGRDEAETWVRDAWLRSRTGPSPSPGLLGASDGPVPLDALADDALRYLVQLQARGPLSVQPTGDVADVGWYIVTSWMLTEAVRRGIETTVDDLIGAARQAYEQDRA